MQSAKPSVDYGLKGLAPIRERDEARSADPARDNGTKNNNPLYYQYRMKNQPKGYVEEKENLRLPAITKDKSYLQNRGAAILAAGNKYKPDPTGNVSHINPTNNYNNGGQNNQRALH